MQISIQITQCSTALSPYLVNSVIKSNQVDSELKRLIIKTEQKEKSHISKEFPNFISFCEQKRLKIFKS